MANLIAVKYDGDNATIGISSDGIYWTFGSNEFGGSSPDSAIWVPEWKLFLVSANWNIYSSSDGVVWVEFTTWDFFSHSQYPGRLRWFPDLGILTLGSSVGTFVTTTDGESYTTNTYLTNTSINEICWCSELELFVACGYTESSVAGGRIATSPDGVTWTLRHSLTTYSYESVVWSPSLSMFFAYADNGRLSTSPDGITWTNQENLFAGLSWDERTFYVVVWVPDRSIFIGISYWYIRTSPDGFTWTTRYSSTSGFLNKYVWSPILERFFVYGYDGAGSALILTSTDGFIWTSSELLHLAYLAASTDITPAPIRILSTPNETSQRWDLSPIGVESSGVSTQGGELSSYTGEPHDILIRMLLTGRMAPLFPPPVPPVDFDGLLDPTVAPICVASDTSNGHLLAGTYRYSYAAWKGDIGQTTTPSPWSEPVTLTSEDTVTLTYLPIPEADGYLVYRREMT